MQLMERMRELSRAAWACSESQPECVLGLGPALPPPPAPAVTRSRSHGSSLPACLLHTLHRHSLCWSTDTAPALWLAYFNIHIDYSYIKEA